MALNKYLAVFLGSLICVGCGGGAATTPPAAPKPAETPSPAASAPVSTTVQTPSGPASAATGSLPADFPKDVPIYTGASIVSSASMAGTHSAVLSTGDPVDKAASFYKDELSKNGWSAPQTVNAAGNTVMRATKEKRQAAISIGKGEDGKTSISISITAMP